MDGLTYLHTRIIPAIHGDLKPVRIITGARTLMGANDSLQDNIYFDNDGHAQIGGFELSWTTLNEPYARTAAFWDVRYKAPEILIGSAATKASDVYALALIGLYLLSGRQPFDGIGSAQLAIAVCDGLKPQLEDHSDPSGHCQKLWRTFDCMWQTSPGLRPTVQEAKALMALRLSGD